MQHATNHLSLDPWSAFLQAGGSPLAFPYGLGMLLLFSPALLAYTVCTLPLSIGMGLTLLAADTALYYLLRSFAQKQSSALLFFYAFSPFVFFICFIHGQLDLIPIALLVAAIYALQKQKPWLAGTSLAWALSAKLNIALAIPFFFIFLWRNQRFRHFLLPTACGFALSCALFSLHPLFSAGFQKMVFHNPEMAKIYALKIALTQGRQVYLVVIAYLFTLYAAWFLRRMNMQILFAFLGAAFSTILLLTDASIGWYMWLIPSLALHYLESSSLAKTLLTAYTALLTVWGLIHESRSFLDLHYESLLLSLLFSIQLVLTLRMVFIGIKENDYFLLSRKPLSIAIAGNSGVGKDTLSESLKNLFGRHSITSLAGDNYHRWNRHSALWKYTTHLHVRANKLEGFSSDALLLMRGQPILSPQYDHATGRFAKSRRIAHNDIVLLNGLHAFLSPTVRDAVDLKIYMEMEDSLCRFLKLRRDTKERNQSKERVLAILERREKDKKFIEPQRGHADLIFKTLPQKSLEDLSSEKQLDLMLQVTVRNATYTENAARALIGIAGLFVQLEESGDASETTLLISGSPKGEDLSRIHSFLAPKTAELLSLNPIWEDGVKGLMQLFCFLHIQEKLYLRRGLR